MDAPPPTRSRAVKWTGLFLKITVSVACLWYVSGKIDFQNALQALGNSNRLFLLLALLCFILSKLLSAFRLNINFRNTGLHLSEWQNIRLYWLGMFYNLFLPGSITGDAYKVILLNKRFKSSYKKTTAAVLLDRFSGLLALGLLLAVYSWFVLSENWYILAIVAGAILAVGLLYIVIKKWMRDFEPGFFSTLLLGLMVQGAQVICIYFLMVALGIPGHNKEYIFLFLVSSIVSVLPLTIGGLGIRELVFLEGSRYFGLAHETAVLISLLFYVITLVTSAAGLWYVFRDPLKRKRTHE